MAPKARAEKTDLEKRADEYAKSVKKIAAERFKLEMRRKQMMNPDPIPVSKLDENDEDDTQEDENYDFAPVKEFIPVTKKPQILEKEKPPEKDNRLEEISRLREEQLEMKKMLAAYLKSNKEKKKKEEPEPKPKELELDIKTEQIQQKSENKPPMPVQSVPQPIQQQPVMPVQPVPQPIQQQPIMTVQQVAALPPPPEIQNKFTLPKPNEWGSYKIAPINIIPTLPKGFPIAQEQAHYSGEHGIPMSYSKPVLKF